MATTIVNGQSTITGTRGQDTLTGSDIPDSIFGGSSHDLLMGLGGPDLLRGGEGSDTLLGGQGNDTLGGNQGPDVLDGGPGGDLMVGGPGDDDYYVDSKDDRIVEKADGGTDSLFITLDTILAPALENLYLGGEARIGIGNDGNNHIGGNEFDNVLRGGFGRDVLIGFAGNDTLLGGPGNDQMNGGAGIDYMAGGGGDDTYYVDDPRDRVVESSLAGSDTLYSTFDITLAPALEHLYLVGSARIGIGNGKANRIRGNDEDNLLQGNGGADTLAGGLGDDTLKGGGGFDVFEGSEGSDTYFVTGFRDVLRGEHTWRAGSDTVVTSLSFAGSEIADIEVIRLVGSGDANAARYDLGVKEGELHGNAGTNVLEGSSQAKDLMLGRLGDDIYVVKHKQDVVIEGANAGTDTVRSAVNYALTAHVEQLELQGDRDLKGGGNKLDNVLVGNSGRNTLNGREGNDTLAGGDGPDTFVFSRALGPTNVDTITDMAAEDTILLHSNVFTALSAGALPASALAFGTAASDADDRIIYDQSTGELYYDADGSGVGAQVLFAVLENTPAVTTDMFAIV